ncbi:MAG: DNA repair protein RecO, partial [Alphaproteobacteria bacterium]
MDWQADAVVLGVRSHGESSAIVSVMTRDHGRYSGLVRGARSRRLRSVLQPGNLVAAHWRARLSEHLGTLTVEPSKSRAALVIADPLRLAALTSVISLVETAVPERDPHSAIHDGLSAVIEVLGAGEAANPLAWLPGIIAFERGLLADMGFPLALDECAVTGLSTGLAYVSPKTGRAVSEEGAGTYKDRLLPLPGFLTPVEQVPTANQILQALDLTGHFLARIIYAPHGVDLPEARA